MTPGKQVTVGVEEEFHLVDPEDRTLSGSADRVLAIAAELGGELNPELQRSAVETATPVCSTLRELHGEIAARRREVLAAADRAGLRVVAAGTLPTPTGDLREAFPRPRYERMVTEYAEVGREQLVCALQVQVGVEDRELAVAALPWLAPWLPVVLALSASSPFYDGRDTGYASYRAVLWSRWPTAGPPLAFASAAEYDALVADLVGSGVITDPGMVYFDVRPSARYPTLEVRVCDAAPLLDDAVTIAGLARALVVTAVRQADGRAAATPRLRHELLRGATWRAARSGLGDVLVDPREPRSVPAREAVATLLEHVRPALDETGDAERVVAGVDAVVRRGTSTERQRAVFEGRQRLADVVDATAEETRAGL
jgi:carboxylate-amine ligase